MHGVRGLKDSRRQWAKSLSRSRQTSFLGLGLLTLRAPVALRRPRRRLGNSREVGVVIEDQFVVLEAQLDGAWRMRTSYHSPGIRDA